MKRFSLITLLLSFLVSALPAAEAKEASLELLTDKEVVDTFRVFPVQEGGRVKPLDTVARFRLLRFHGKQSITAEIEGKSTKLSAMEWLLVTWFRPDLAKTLPVFVVDNSDAVIQIGVKAKGKRDRYSYNELIEGRTLLMKKMKDVRAIEEKQRTPEQRALGKLSLDFLDFEMMLSHLDFARAPLGEDTKEVPAELLAPPAAGQSRIATLLPKMGEYFKAHPEAAAPMANPWFGSFYRAMLGAMMSGNEEQVLRIFPPAEGKVEVWQSPGNVLQAVLETGTADAHALGLLSKYEALYDARLDSAAFKAAAKGFNEAVLSIESARNDARHVTMEVGYHKADYFYNSLLYFVSGLLILALSWAAPLSNWGKWCVRISALLLSIGLIYATVGIVIRCLIMERPPITTLYETILFITATGVLIGLLAELMTRKGIGLTVAAFAGTAGMFLSIRFMNMEGTDTLQQLQAVLITNFWLATHVPCINLGYSAGMVAAILSMIYIVQRVFGSVKLGDARAKDLTRIGYGFVMAGLFLSLVGTILGGIWANYSWGRFWGWDPKENGALMIVLMNLVILHARLGGYIREVGFHACNIVLGMIVVFSWFGVNQLGVGLHAYGFTDGVWFWLGMFWLSQIVLLLGAAFVSWSDRQSKKQASMPRAIPQAN